MREGRNGRSLRQLSRSFAAIALLVLGCKAPARNDAPVALPPVPAPPDLLAEATIAAPDLSWRRLQHGLGGATGVLPASLGSLLSSAAGLDARLAAEVNGAAPAYAVVAGKGPSRAWVLAARLVEERRARPLFEGKDAVFDVADGGAGMVLLRARPARASAIAAAYAPGGWIVVGSSEAAVEALGPYATRSLAAKPVEAPSIVVDVPGSAFDGELADRAARSWAGVKDALQHDDAAERAAHGGRAPDFGEPGPIVQALDAWVGNKIAVLRDLAGAHVTIDLRDDDLRSTVLAAPRAPDGPAKAALGALHPGDALPLARAPRETVLGFVTRDDAPSRAKDADAVEAATTATLGPRLAAGDRKALHAALGDWSAARDDWFTFALAMTAKDRAAILDVSSSDPARTARGVGELVTLAAHAPALRDPLESWLGASGLAVESVALPGAGQAWTAKFAKGASVAMAWAPGRADVKLALAEAPLPLVGGGSGGSLGDDAAVRMALVSLGDVSAAIVAQPGRAPGCTANGAIVLGWGSRAAPDGHPSLWAELGAPYASLRCIVRSVF
jgi:hypothetical protein